jgi:AraC-like DNA-binding protein/ribose 5-phosphate isomerase RpiB
MEVSLIRNNLLFTAIGGKTARWSLDRVSSRATRLVIEPQDEAVQKFACKRFVRVSVRISIDSDRCGLEHKRYLIARLSGYADVDARYGGGSDQQDDCFAIVSRLTALIRSGEVDRVLLLCADALGAAMYANKQPAIRAGLCHHPEAAGDGVREHNMNFVVMDAAAISYEVAFDTTETFLTALYADRLSLAGMPPECLEVVISHIRSNLDEPLDVAKLARLVRMSPSHFSKLFKISLGVSPHQFILQERVDRSRALLRNSTARIVDIAFEVGFETQAHFTTVFGKLVGMTPRQFRCWVTSGSRQPTRNSLFLIHRTVSPSIKEQRELPVPRASSRAISEPTDVRDTINHKHRRREGTLRESLPAQTQFANQL